MTTDLDQDIYKDDFEFLNDQLYQFSEKDNLPSPKREDFQGIKSQIMLDYDINPNILRAPSIKLVQEGVFQIWRKYVRLNRKKLYQFCYANDISRKIKLILKNPLLEPERMIREGQLQKSYRGYCLKEDFLKLDFQLINEREFHDFLHVMGAVNKRYEALNYLQLLRNTYMRLPVLEEMSRFKRVNELLSFTKEIAAAKIQITYKRYKFHVTEEQKQIKMITSLSAEDLFELLTKKIQDSKHTLKEIFEMFDKNGDGQITFYEFVQAFQDSKIVIAHEILKSVFNHFDVNKSNSIQYMEFLSKLQIKETVSNQSLLNTQLKVDDTLKQFRQIMQRKFQNFEECFNSLKAADRLKISRNEFIEFVQGFTLRFSKIQLETMFHYLDSGQKNYLNIEDFSQVYLDKPPQQLRQQKMENQDLEQKALDSVRSQIEDAKYLYHYIQAENMQDFIESRNNQLVDLLKTGQQQQSAINMKDIDNRVNIFRNHLLKLEIFIQQFSIKCSIKIQNSGLSIKQYFSQFTQKFPEKFMEAKEFMILVNVLFNQVMDTNLCMAAFKVFSNYYVQRISYAKFVDMIKLGSMISPIQLRMKYNYGSFINKMKPKLTEEFQKLALTSVDLKTITLRQTFEILQKFSLNLEIFEVQKLADEGVIFLQEKRYLVDYNKLLDLLFPDIYIVEQAILKYYGQIILQRWFKVKRQFLINKKSGKFQKKATKKVRQPKPIGIKRSLKEKIHESMPNNNQQNEYQKLKSGESYAFVKTIILECIEGAAYYAESQIFTKQKQNQYQKRPTQKDVFIVAKFQEFDLNNLLGTISFDYITQRLYSIDSQGTLYTQDITSNRLLANINVGNRIPYNKSFIMDSIIFNSRMFILKSNWQLQLWNLAQKSDRPEQSIDLREGAQNAFEPFKHLYECEQQLLVLSSQRTFVHLISSVSLHIIKSFNLTHCVDYHFKSMDQAINAAAKRIIFETNQKYPLNFDMNLEQLEQQENQRRQALNFFNLFKDVKVQKGKLLHFLSRSADEREKIKLYLEEISDDEGYISQQQFDEIFKSQRQGTFNIWDALSIIRLHNPNLKQLFSIYDDGNKNTLFPKQIKLMLDQFEMPEQARNDFVSAFPNGLTYQKFVQLVEQGLVYEELIYRCQQNHINLNELLKQSDHFDVGLLDRSEFQQVLDSLPFGLLDNEIQALSSKQVYDSESGRIKYRETYKVLKQRIYSIQYINDIDVLLYSVTYPKRGTIFCQNEKILALLEGHQDAPLIQYCKQSGCLISAQGLDLMVWSVYKDLTLQFDVNPPWHLTPQLKIKCSSQIHSLTYLSFAQLIAVGSQDGVELWDPVSIQQKPQKISVRIKPGYYQDIEDTFVNNKIPFVQNLEIGKIKTLQQGCLQTPFRDGDNSILLTFEFLITMTDLQMSFTSKTQVNNIQIYIIHRQPIDVPLTQIDQQVPLQIKQDIETELIQMLDQAFRSKRAKGVIGIEKEMNKELLKSHTKKNLIKLSKQLIFQKDNQLVIHDIMNEIIHSCKYNGGLNISFVYNLLRQTQCLNPHNISFEEFKHILLYSVEYKPSIKQQNQIEQKLQLLVREGKIDFALEFEKAKAMKIQNDKILLKHQFKKILLKLKAYSNENDLQEFLNNDCVSLKSLNERFHNDKLIYKLRMIARPDQIIKEIQNLGNIKHFLSRLALQDQNGDGILTKKQFMEAVLDSHALFSEFFDLYSESIQNEPMIRVTQIVSKLLSIENNLQYKKTLLTLGKVRNSLVYRNLGFNYIFKEPEMPFIDFIDAILDLKIQDVTKDDAKLLAEFLAIDSHKYVPFVSFQHYMNKLHAADSYLLVNDYEQLLNTANLILAAKDQLKVKFHKASCASWEIRAYINFVDIETADNFIIKVLGLQEMTYDSFIDKVVNFINKISFEKDHKESNQGIKSILVSENNNQSFKNVIKVAEMIKEQSHLQSQKIFEQCLQFDSDRNGFLELPVFTNIVAYNTRIPQELLVVFQYEWQQLSSEKNINYNRFFTQYVKFEYQQQEQIQQTNLNLIFRKFTDAVKKSQVNLGFIIKRFYNYDNQEYMTNPQFIQLLSQIDLVLQQQEQDEILQYFGSEIKHQDLIKAYNYTQMDIQVVFEPNIWLLASQQISLTTLNKLGKWNATQDAIKASDFKRLFSQYDNAEQNQIIKYACVGSRATLKDAMNLSKEIKLGSADLSHFYVNPQFFSQSIPLIIKEKLDEKARKTNNHVSQLPNVQEKQEVVDEEISALAVRIQKSINNIQTTFHEIVLNGGIEINAKGQINRNELKKILGSLPYQWKLVEKHYIYEKFKDTIDYEELANLLGEKNPIQKHMKIIYTKLFMGCYRKNINLSQLFNQGGKPLLNHQDMLQILTQFMSQFEASILVQENFIIKEINEAQFIDTLKSVNFDHLQLLFRNGIQILNESFLYVLHEFEEMNKNEYNLAQIQQTFSRMGVSISQQVLFCLLNNFIFSKTQMEPMYGKRVLTYKIKDFLQYLTQIQVKYTSKIKMLFDKLQEANLSIFEFFAVCDTHTNYAITRQELMYGYVQLKLPFIDIWDELEKVDTQVPFSNFLQRFIQVGCVNITEIDTSVETLAAATRKLGNLNEAFQKLSDNGRISYKSLKIAQQKYQLQLTDQNIQDIYLYFKNQHSQISYKEYAQIMQQNRQVEIVFHAFQHLQGLKLRDYPDHITLDQFKQFLSKRQIPSQDANIILNSFHQSELTGKEILQKVQDYSNLKTLKEQLSSERILSFCHQIIACLKGQPNQFTKVYTQFGIGSANTIKYEDFYAFVNYLEIQFTNTETRLQIKSTDVESYLRRSQSQVRTKTLDHTKKQEINDILHKGIKNILNSYKAKQIKLSNYIDQISLADFLGNFVVLNENQINLLIESIQDHTQIQKITWGDFAVYLLEDKVTISQVFFKECLEIFQSVMKKLNIRSSLAVNYFGNKKITQTNFLHMMLSLGYNPIKLRLNVRNVHSLFQMYGGDEMSDLEFLMLMTEQEQTQISQQVLELLLKIFKQALKLEISKQQLYALFNINRSGWLQKDELVQAIHVIDDTIPLTQIRALATHMTQGEQLINVAQLVKLIYVGGSLNDNSLEVQAFLTKHYQKQLLSDLIHLEQIDPNSDGLVQQITISAQDFFRLIPNHKEADIALIVKSFGLKQDQLDLEAIYDTLVIVGQDFELTENKLGAREIKPDQEELEKSVVLKYEGQQTQKFNSNIQIFENEIVQHICAILNQNQMSLMKSVFQDRGYLNYQEFQVILNNIGVPLTYDQTRTLIKIIDKKSEGNIIHYTELLAQIEAQGFVIIKDDVQNVAVSNQLLQKFCSLDFGSNNYPDEMNVKDFYRLVTSEGSRNPFSDAEFQRLANLFTYDGMIQKKLLQRVLGTKKQQYVDQNFLQKELLINIFYRFNGFNLVLTQIKDLRELFNSSLDQLKDLEDSGISQISLQIQASRLSIKITMLHKYLLNDIQLIQAAAFSTLNNNFQVNHIQPFITLRSERNKISQMQIRLSGIFLTQIPETQFQPLSIPVIEGKQVYKMHGKIAATNQLVRVQVWTVPILQTVCYDGQPLRLHIYEELRFQAVLPQSCQLLGVLEKKNNMGTEIHSFVLDNGKSLRQVCQEMGGLLKIPQLVLSGQIIFVAKFWISQILSIFCEIQSYGYCYPIMRSEILYLIGDEIRINDLNGIQSTGMGRFNSGIDIKLLVETVYETTFQELSLAPEFYTKPLQEITEMADTWQFGVLIFEILFGNRPNIISNSIGYDEKTQKHHQLIQPSDYESGDILQKEVFQNLAQQLYDIIDVSSTKLTQQIQIQLTQKSLGAYIKELFKNQTTDQGMLDQLTQIIDLMCVCLQYEPTSRPSLSSIQRGHLFSNIDLLNSKQIARPIINYKNPRIIYHQQIYKPARQVALYIMKGRPVNYDQVLNVIQLFSECLQQSIADEHKLDLISYVFHSRLLDIMNFVVLNLNHQKESNQIVVAFAQLFVDLQKHLASMDNPASQHVEAILNVLVKFTLGEPFRLVSDSLFMQPEQGFFQIQRDEVDEAWNGGNYIFSMWTPTIYKIAGPIYKDMISESGVGSGNMVAIRNYIQLCTEKNVSPFDMNTFALHQSPFKYNTIARTAEYYNEVISISDAQLQIANYLSGHHSKTSLKIALNYVGSLVKCNKLAKLQVLADTRITSMLVSLITENESRTMVVGMLHHISNSFKNEVPNSLKIEHSQAGMVQQYQQNNAVHLLRNLSIITHVLNNSKSKLSNERFLSFQPTEHNQSEQSKVQQINLFISQQIFTLPNVYQGLFCVIKSEPDLVFSIVSNLLQWPHVGLYGLGGVTQQLLLEMFRPMALQAEHKKSPFYQKSVDLYDEIVTMALPNTIQLIHQSKVRVLLQSYGLNVPDKSSSDKFTQLAKNLINEWNLIKKDTIEIIRDNVTYYLNNKQQRKTVHNPYFAKLKMILKQIQAFVVYTSKEVLLQDFNQRSFLRQTIAMIMILFKDIIPFGQLHQESNDILHSISEFIVNICFISPLLIFDVEDMKFTQESFVWMKETIDYIYEYHIEWDRANEEKRIKLEEQKKLKQEELEKNQQYLEQLQQSKIQAESKITQKNVTFKINDDQSKLMQSKLSQQSLVQSRIEQSAIKSALKSEMSKQQEDKQKSEIKTTSKIDLKPDQKQLQQSRIIKKDQRLQESVVKQSTQELQYALNIELRPYSENKLIGVALNLLKALTAVVDSNIQQYLQLLGILYFGTWFSNLTFKMWIIFERVVANSLEQSLIIKNQVDESMVRTTLFEALAKCQSQQLQDQLIQSGYIKGIFAYLLSNNKSFELQKIVKSHSYVPFIHWMPYRHEALIFFTAIIWERKNCTNFFNEMMIEVHARNILQEESNHISSKIDQKSKELNSTIMFTRVYMLCLLISAQDSGLIFLMKQLKINQKLLQLFQANEDFRQLFQGIYQYLQYELCKYKNMIQSFNKWFLSQNKQHI
ncbi:hypothetical protein pb186bvf_005722 [Paramecium bursaria]